MDKKKPENRKRRRGADAVAVNKIQKPLLHKLSKPIDDPLDKMEIRPTSPCTSTIKLEEVQYTEVSGLENIPKSEAYFEDPSNWSNLCDEDIKQIVSKGPIQIRDYSFPKRNNRKFTITSYQRSLANGKFLPRTWLIYSKSKDSVFCFCCFLFATKKISQALSSTGCCDWPHLSAILKGHESSVFHMENFKTWKYLEKSLALNPTIDTEFECSVRAESKHWIAVTQRLFTLVKFLGSQVLAYPGSSHDLNVNNGNFLQLVKEVASFDSILGEHLRRITSQETLNKYLNKNIQHEIISIISTTVTNKIVSMVKEAKYYSIIVDSITDKSLREQVTIVLRFVHNNHKTFEVKEHFLGFIKEDELLTNSILDKLQFHGIFLSNCRGQSYDSSSNMKAKDASTQNEIRNLEPRAFLVPCCSHSLSLEVNDLARCSSEAVKFFDVVQCLYNFVSSSTIRWEIFIKNVPDLALIQFSETSRWESSLEALKPLTTNLGDIYEALIEISDKGNPEEKNTAESLGCKIFDFKFICCSLIWFDILEKITTTSTFLQRPCVDFSAVTGTLQNTKRTLVEMGSYEKFNDYVQSAESIALRLEIPTELTGISRLRSRRIKREKDVDEKMESCRSATDRFKVEFYFKILDQAIGSITERSQQLEIYNKNFSFLNNISECSKNKNLRSLCVSLQKSLTTKESEDIDGTELSQELLVLSPLIRQGSSSLEVLNFILSSNLEDLAPNVVIALRILNTLPVTREIRGYSKLKLIQNYIRNTTSQQRYEDLSIMAIETELVKSLDYDDLISEFAKSKARKTLLLD